MRRSAHLFIILLSVAICYSNSWQGTFQFDDHNVIVANPVVHSWSAWRADLAQGIRPLLKLTYTWNWVSGYGLLGFHLVNILFHAANSLLLFCLAGTLFPTLSTASRLVSVLLFAVHPLQTEAVTYICGRSVSQMALFYLGSLLLFFLGRARGNGWMQFFLSPLLFLMAVLTKEVAFTLPLALVLCQVAQGERGGIWRWFAGQWVHWGLLFVLCFLLLAHRGYGHLLEACFDVRGIVVNVLTQINGILYLLSRIAMPQALSIDPDLPLVTTITGPGVAGGIALMALLVAGCQGLARGQVAGFGILWFLLHLLPTNSLIPRLDVANDRQLYLASWGLFLACAVWGERVQGRVVRGGLMVAVCLALFVLAGLTLARNRVYRSEIALWEDTATQSPGKARVHNNLGYAYELAHRRGDAEKAYLRALALDPGSELARANLSRLREGRRGGE